jgi:endo-1,4-beta-D-glucanase Y
MLMSFKSYKTLILAAALMFAVAVSVSAQYKPLYYRDMPKVSTSYDTVLQKTWEGIKARNVDAYTTGLVHRPKSNQPHDAVSEGVAYGMFLALYCNDQTYFNKIWDAGEKYMWNSEGNYYDWRVNRSGSLKTGTGPASDADQDIALLLIFADRLVKNNIWASYTSTKGAGYAARAREILQTVRTSMVENNYLLPGHWGSSSDKDTKNPGYFAPAFYRIFAEFDSTNRAEWMALVDGSYELIAKSPGYSKGLIPDWCTMSGATTGGAGYNAYFDGDALYRDAIRVYWRLATDYLWYKEPRAKTFLDKAIVFLEGLGGAEKANFFDMKGNLLPADDTEILAIGDGDIERTRREHSHLTAGMWAAAAMASGGPELAESYSASLLKFYKPGTDYWGYAVDPSGGIEDTLHNETYFDQFLAWFGASLLGGTFTNVWVDLKNGVPAGPLAWKTLPPALLPNWDIDASVRPFTLGASFNRSTSWTVTLTHESAAGQTRTFSGSSDTVNLVWYGLNEAGAYMQQGFYTLKINAGNLSYTTEVWLGRPYAGNAPNLITGNRLLVDDFADGDIYPYIGNVWQTFSDANRDGGSSGAVMTPTAASGNAGGRLEWNYNIRSGASYPFVALDWNCRTSSGGNLDLSGIDSVIIVARSKTSTLNVSVQLIDTDDPNDYHYFEDSISLTTTSRTYGLRLSSTSFSQRLSGSGRNFNTTLSNMMALRFHMQYEVNADQSSDAIIIERMYLSGPSSVLSRLYTPPTAPPAYIPPAREPISVKYRASRNAAAGYTIKRVGNNIRITLPDNMAGANARIIDIRGRTIKRVSVPQGGSFDISIRNLAAGMYFMEVRKQGKAALRVQLGNVR